MPKLLIIFSLINIIIVYYLLNRYYKKKQSLAIEIQDFQEKINILNTENRQENENKIALEEKIKRYNSLKEIVEEIDQNLDLEYIGDSLTAIAFSFVANNKGTCILYSIDSQTQKLSLFKTKKEDKELIIKAKEGDIFDFWVLRHASPLLIEDIKKGIKADNYCVIPDRRDAIKKSLSLAAAGDIVLIAGKGHEGYQILKDRTLEFDDREVVRKYLDEESGVRS